MSGRTDELRIEVLGDEITVFLPATSYGVTYYKPADSSQLLAKNYNSKNDSRAPITEAEFLARAWQAASAKARELGWIV
jgi:predicted alpha/beta hydrolase family esterase